MVADQGATPRGARMGSLHPPNSGSTDCLIAGHWHPRANPRIAGERAAPWRVPVWRRVAVRSGMRLASVSVLDLVT